MCGSPLACSFCSQMCQWGKKKNQQTTLMQKFIRKVVVHLQIVFDGLKAKQGAPSPCPWQGVWNQMIFRVSSIPNHFMILLQEK